MPVLALAGREVTVDASMPLWPLAVYVIAVVLLLAVILGLSYLLGPRHHERATAEPYESGILPTGTARVRQNVGFYLVAMFFVIFDLEAVFIFAWAQAARELGWPGYAEVVVFIGVLMVALIYLWRLGALDWRTTMKEPEAHREHRVAPAGVREERRVPEHALVHEPTG